MDQKASNEQMIQAQMMMPMSASVLLQTDQYPDLLQQCSIEQCKLIFEALALPSNQSLVNKVGSVGGYTALHWCVFLTRTNWIRAQHKRSSKGPWMESQNGIKE